MADRIIVVADGRARVIEGDYETYQRLAAQEAEALATKAARAKESEPSEDVSSTKGDRRKRKFPYRKPDDVEKEIGAAEAEVAELEDKLGMPATWRDPIKAKGLQQRLEDLHATLPKLYEHWEEALELNA